MVRISCVVVVLILPANERNGENVWTIPLVIYARVASACAQLLISIRLSENVQLRKYFCGVCHKKEKWIDPNWLYLLDPLNTHRIHPYEPWCFLRIIVKRRWFQQSPPKWIMFLYSCVAATTCSNLDIQTYISHILSSRTGHVIDEILQSKRMHSLFIF